MPDAEPPPLIESGGGDASRDVALLAQHVEDLYDGLRRLTGAVRELTAKVDTLQRRVDGIERATPWSRPPTPKPPKLPPRSQPRREGP